MLVEYRPLYTTFIISYLRNFTLGGKRMAQTFRGYRITSPYGSRRNPFNKSRDFHAGVDLVKKHRAPIYAFTAGEVIYAGIGKSGTGLGGYGNVVLLLDKNNNLQLYAHLNSVAVRTGRRVNKNQLIGYQGNTGQSTGSHLHLEIRTNGDRKPPYGYRANRASSTIEPIGYLNSFDSSKSEKTSPSNNTSSASGILRRGMRGREVLQLQEQLKKAGINISKYGADGIYGQETEQAVTAFQRQQKLKVDGIAGPVTRAALQKIVNENSKGFKTLRRGMSGKEVKELQQELIAVGIRLAKYGADGKFGKETEEAVKEFQSQEMLRVDGIVGAETWKKLNNVTSNIEKYPGTLIKKGSRGVIVKVIQRKVGTDPDGIYGSATEAAVRRYQKNKGLQVDGIVGPETWKSLF